MKPDKKLKKTAKDVINESKESVQAEADIKPEDKVEAKPEAKPEVKPEIKPESEADALQKLSADLNDKYLRSLAEFDNFRKRSEKERASAYNEGAKDIVAKLLPVIDNFERALMTGDDSAFCKGVELIYKQLQTVLEGLGVTVIESVGQPFDTDIHNAVMHIEDDSIGENIVVEELQKGYKFKDKVVRHSMVKVAN